MEMSLDSYLKLLYVKRFLGERLITEARYLYYEGGRGFITLKWFKPQLDFLQTTYHVAADIPLTDPVFDDLNEGINSYNPDRECVVVVYFNPDGRTYVLTLDD